MNDLESPLSEGSVKRFHRFLLLTTFLVMLVLVSFAATYAWYFWTHPCEVETVREASARLVTKRNTYDHAYQFATTVSRTSLEHPVNSLKLIFMDTQDMDVPVCMQRAKEELIEYMGTVIRAFDAYGAGEADPAIWDLINIAETHYDNFSAELEAVNKCAPYCFPYISSARLRP